MLNKIEELAWISRCKLFRDEKAFGRLVDSWSGRIRRFFLMQTGGDEMLSDDLAQETFIRVWKRIHELDQVAKFSSWIYRIAYNIWIDRIRIRRLTEPVESLSVVDPAGASDRIEGRDLHIVLLDALQRLNEAERTTLTLYYLSELSIKEIMAVTNMAEGTVKSNLARGREKLRREPELIKWYDEK